MIKSINYIKPLIYSLPDFTLNKFFSFHSGGSGMVRVGSMIGRGGRGCMLVVIYWLGIIVEVVW